MIIEEFETMLKTWVAALAVNLQEIEVYESSEKRKLMSRNYYL